MLIMLKLQVLVLFSISIALMCWQNVVCGSDLPVLNVDKTAISVSGVSSGAAMATQLHVAFSRTFMGAGLIAGVPNMCTPALACMNTPSLISPAVLETLTATAVMLGNIDLTTNLRDDRVWVFAGTADTVVNPGAGSKVVDYYRYYVSHPNQVTFVNTMRTEHGQITKNYGGNCGTLNRNDYMNNCNYSAAFHLLDHIYGNLLEPQSDYVTTGTLYYFSQKPFTFLAFMDDIGYIYIPTRCQDKSRACRLHVALHGCQMGRARIGEVYVRHAGYNEVADLNDIIVLYPQVVVSTFNPNGCWDWFGYTGAFYAVQEGPQMQAIHNMVKHVSGL